MMQWLLVALVSVGQAGTASFVRVESSQEYLQRSASQMLCLDVLGG